MSPDRCLPLARDDSDFDSLRNDPAFKQLIEL
jgi:hypothetical protein